MHIRALSGDIDASGSFVGSLKGLAIAISLCNSETTQIKGKPSNSKYVEVWRPHKSNERSTEHAGT